MTLNIDNTYLEFTSNKKPMQAARIEKSLDLQWELENGIFSRKQIVYDLLQEGRRPTVEKNYSYYSARIEGYTKPRTLYKLEDVETGSYLEINKTLYDFANYIIDKDFLDIEKAKRFIENEQAELQRIEEEERQKEIEAQQKRKEEQEQREIERKERQQAYNKKYLKLGQEFIQRLKHDPIKQLLDEYVPEYIKLDETENNRIVPENEVKTFYNNMYDSLAITLGDYSYCNHTIKRYAENQKDGNFRKWDFRNVSLFLGQQLLLNVYSEIDLLNDHVNTINAKMNAIYYGKDYKGSKPIQEYEFYYVISNKEREYHKAVGQRFKMEGITFYLRKLEDGAYTTTEEASGLAIVRGLTNKKEIVQKTREAIKNRKEQIERVIKREIESGGGTPLYKERLIAN